MGAPKSSGSATQTTSSSNKTADTLLPYVTYGLDSAKDVFQQNRDKTGLNDQLNSGYQDLYNTSTSDTTKNTGQYATDYLNGALNGGDNVYSSPAYGSLYDLSLGTTDSQKKQSTAAGDLYSLAKTDNKDYTTGTGELSKESGGYYLNSNPYIDKVYDTEANKITDKYQTATAPNTDSTYETSGRYGSGSALNAQGMNEKALGSSLDSLAADTYYKNYNDERKLQNSAAKDLGTLGQNQQKLQGSLLDASGNQYGSVTTGRNTGSSNLQSGYDKGNANTLNALSLYPATQTQTFYPATQEIAAGKGTIGAPYYNTSLYQGLLPTGYGSSSSGSTTSPIYGPSALSTGTSLLGSGTSAYKSLGGGGLGKGGAASTGLDSSLYGDVGGTLGSYGLSGGGSILDLLFPAVVAA